MKAFKEAIKAYLDKRAAEDPQFATSYAKPKKSIDECCRFIIGEARKKAEGGQAVLPDSEVYGLAVHYYDEDNIKVTESAGGATVSRSAAVSKESAKIELTAEEKEQARKMAMERAIEEQRKKMTERKAKAKKDEAPQPEQMSLFEF